VLYEVWWWEECYKRCGGRSVIRGVVVGGVL
jgi:hypothetical protein